MKELNKKLAKIQKDLKAPKNQVNNFGGYNYRSCEDIMEAVKPMLGDLVLIVSDEIVQVGDRYYVRALARLSDGENYQEVSAYAREAENKKGMDESQITGAASSYARKYALNGLFAIDDTKDADTQDNHQDHVKAQKDFEKSSKVLTGKITSSQVGMIGALANKELGWSNLKLSKVTFKLFKESKLPELTKAQASRFIDILQNEIKKQNVKETIDVGDEDHVDEQEINPEDIDLDLDSVIEEMENENKK